jgi:hypothetical protein
VTLTELTHQNVPVKMLTITNHPLVNVNHVTTNVLPVLLMKPVTFVLKTESTNQNVSAQMVTMMVVLLNAYHVTGDVQNVINAMNNLVVLNVLILESKPQLVHVQTHTMKN